ncbi:MAG: quinone-dependent dihydroorotate dehydrogenase [Candidatus Promineifilaceae bacterium]
MYEQVIFPLLKRVDPETAHDRVLRLLALAQSNWLGKQVLRLVAGSCPRQPVTLWGLTFPNVLGMAAGFDKDVRVAAGLGLLGFGHVEVGTLTPKPQAGNARPRIFRLPEDGAVINRMGFPNGGVAAALPRLVALGRRSRPFILGVSVGKQKETPLAEAAGDYVAVMTAVYPYTDYLAVNISSPNTPGLRELQGGNYLGHLLATLAGERDRLAVEQGRKRPLLVKIAPDLDDRELDDILTAVSDTHIDGIIATNTTIQRVGLRASWQNETGGLSGRPLKEKSRQIVAAIHRRTQGKLPIIGVGGIETADDIKAMLDAGASLVQIYTSFIYYGPSLPGKLLRQLKG